MSRELRAGVVPSVYALWVPVYLVGLFTLAALPLVRMAEHPLGGSAVLAPLALLYTVALPVTLVAQLLLSAGALLGMRKVARGTEGRARLVILGWAGLAHPLLQAGLSALLAEARITALLAHGAGPRVLGEVQYELPPPLSTVYWIVLAGTSASLLTLLVAELGCWFLLPKRARFVIWIGVDAIVVVAFVLTTLFFPLRPSELSPDVLQPALRLTATTLFVLRALARLLAPVLDVVEHTGFNALVAARMLRAGKSGFLTAIGTLSILAVSVSSCALTTTLSVMGGFRQDLKRKILGNSAHVVIDREHGTFDGWLPVLERVRATRNVTGASPYAAGEVMVSSASNLSGAVLRGIDPDTVSQVTDLERNLTRGRMAYLRHPEQLVDLPREQIDGALLPLERPMFRHPDAGVVRVDPTNESHGGGGLVRDLDAILSDTRDGGVGDAPPARDGGAPHAVVGLGDPRDRTPRDPRDDGLRGGGIRLDDYLLPEDDLGPRREVLPGIIVGQELARTLRLFVGDEVSVVSPLGGLGPSGPVPKSRAFRVAGIFYSGMYEYDMKYVYVTLPVAQDFLSTGEAISGIEIKVREVERAPEAAITIRRGIHRSDLRVRDWQETNRNLFGALALEKLAMFIALGIAIIVAGFCVFGTLTLMVQEKAREVGVLKAMGTKPAGIVGAFLLTGLLIGLFGASIGLGAGYVACFAAEHFGIQMNPEVYYIDKLPVAIDATEFLLVFVASVAVCIMATVFPAMLASRLKPVDALRFD